MIFVNNTDRLLTLAMQSIGGECSYISYNSRWLNYHYDKITFSAFSTRFPFDDPRRICEIDNKLYARSMLARNNIRLIPWQLVSHGTNSNFDASWSSRWVIKPILGSKGSNVITNLSCDDVNAILQELPPGYSIIEPYLKGKVLRVLVLQNKIIGAYEKLSPFLVGDGISTIEQLLNAYVKRVNLYFGNELDVDEDIQRTVNSSAFSKKDILNDGQPLVISNVNNVCRGSIISPINVDSLESTITEACIVASSTTGLNLIGVDVLVSDSTPYILETNPSPGIFGHSVDLDSQGRIESIDLTISQIILGSVIRYLNPNADLGKPVQTKIPYFQYKTKNMNEVVGR